jgi:hypothetical protein
MTDWDSIKKDYELSSDSIREVAKKHGISDKAIRNKAKELKWRRIKDMEDHIEAKATGIAKVRELVRKEKECGLSADFIARIDEKTNARVALIEQYSIANNRIVNRLLGMLSHDSHFEQDADKPFDPSEYGKIKLASDVLTASKKNMLGDASLMDLKDATEIEKEDDMQWAIAIPAAEKLRVDAIKAKK